MSNNLALISSAISAISGLKVITSDNLTDKIPKDDTLDPDNFCQFLVSGPVNTAIPDTQQFDIKSFHQSYLVGGLVGAAPLATKKKPISDVKSFQLSITTLTNGIITVRVRRTTKVRELKKSIHIKESILPDQQQLTFDGKQLEDEKALGDYDIQEKSILHLTFKGKFYPQYALISHEFLDPRYNYDFTNANDDGRKFMRGQYEYKRPLGWNRIALKVLDKYENNHWLGVGSSRRTHSTSACVNEWPVSYHGTEKHNFNSISDQGYLLSKGKRFAFGYGIYSTPDIKIAARYAKEFTHEEEKYKMVFQNRVNPENLIRISAVKTRFGGEFWISPSGEDIRPYGICIKKV
ncbi:11585_t:CDS:1 [Acaulospora morrowiae]|uniref:11585_t:CDS:1 n=1 Tax=Acaulospora morrowiae TaxID=94023 RepID=A0A9N9GFA4_9GLOM|nr:11585_t:CDS:1 [Acaulospora morrowiae]